MYQVVRKTIDEILAPLAPYFLRKSMVLKRRAELGHEYKLLALKLLDPSCRDQHEAIVEKLEQLYDEIDQLSKPLAFGERAAKQAAAAAASTSIAGSPPPSREQLAYQEKLLAWQYNLAASYCDVWTVLRDAKGVICGGMMTFYVCMRKYGDGSVCASLMGSKVWDRRHADIFQSKQRFYCRVCGGRYYTRYGSALQLTHPTGGSFWARAECPWAGEEDDVKAMALEDALDPSSPQDLFNRVPEAKPFDDKDFLRKARPEELCSEQRGNPMADALAFKILPVAEFQKMPKWPWAQLMAHLRTGTVPGAVPDGDAADA